MSVFPAQIPDHVEVDAEPLQIGQGIRVQDVTIPQGVKVLDDGNLMVAHVTAKISEAKLEALLTRTTEEGQPEGAAVSAEKAKVEEPTPAAGTESKPKEEKK